MEGPAIILPETFAAIATLFVLAIYLDWNPKGLKSLLILLCMFVFFDLGYYYAVVIVLPFIAFLQIWPVRRLGRVAGPVFVCLSLATTVGGILFYGETIGSQMTPVSLSFVGEFMLAAYTPLLLIFVLVGFIFGIFFAKDSRVFPLICYGLFVVVLLAIPIPFATRTEIFGRPEFAMIASMGVFGLISLVTNERSRKRLVLAAILILVSTPILILPYQSWFSSTVQVTGWHGLSLDTFSQDEGNAGLWLRKNASPGSFIITDIESSAIMQSVSGLPGLLNPILFLSNYTLLSLTYSALNATTLTGSIQILRQISAEQDILFCDHFENKGKS